MPQTLRLILFLSTLTLLLSALSWHVHRRLVGAFQPSTAVRRGLTAVWVFGLLGGFGARLLAPYAPEMVRVLALPASTITVGVMIASILMWPYELVRLAREGWQRLRRSDEAAGESPGADAAAEQPAVQEPERRAWLKQVAVGSVASVGFGASGYGAWVGRRDFTLDEVALTLPRLPRELEGFVITQLSDLHIGLFVGDAELRAALDLVEQARPDLVVLTGDLLDSDPRYAPQLGRFVRQLSERSRVGVSAILGNHDHYAGATAVRSVLEKGGATVLHNRHQWLGDAGARFALCGVDDVWAARYSGGGPDLDAALQGVGDQDASLLLCHNPSFFPAAAGRVDAQISGHTHGGQVSLFINPAELVLRHGYVRGTYEAQGSHLYVNRGFGTAGPPVRVGSAPEVSKHVLTRAT